MDTFCYTTFSYSDMSVRPVGDGSVECTLKLANTGKRDGAEVVQIYVKPLNPSVNRPVHELKAFEKVWLKSGESREVKFILGRDAFSFYDVTLGDWKYDKCRYLIEAGSSTRNIHLGQEINLD